MGGYIGRVLFINLSSMEIKQETINEKLYREFFGGYGLGARILYSHQKAGVDPLGPQNTLGFITGVMTGTPALFTSRYTVVAKSPLTGTWGDANSGGDFGPFLKFAGYDGVFFTGISDDPVYLFINEGKVELKDARHLWGRDTHDTEDMIISELGKGVHVTCIGPSGEKLSLISGIINNKGRAAARSGLGAVMGSKKLKAIAVRGTQEVPVANLEHVRELRKKYLAEMIKEGNSKRPAALAAAFMRYGTTLGTEVKAHNGDTPVKNWGGVGIIDFPDVSPLSAENIERYTERKYACWRCPLGCGGHMKEGKGIYKYPAGVHRPEYETLGAFGAMCLNNNIGSIIKANDICNRYGLDTISTGCTIAFAIECFENGLISKEDTEGIELTWGNHEAITAVVEKLAKREGFGDILADGVKVAAQKIGNGAEQYVVHIQGQEIALHDPKMWDRERWAISYTIDATPARHTQGWEWFTPPGMELPPKEKVGERHKIGNSFIHVVNAAGFCILGPPSLSSQFIPEFMNAVTGWNMNMEDILLVGERIANLREAFNIREGLNLLSRRVPGRFLGIPPQEAGPLAGVTVELQPMIEDYLVSADWDSTGRPSRTKLLQLRLGDIADELWPDIH